MPDLSAPLQSMTVLVVDAVESTALASTVGFERAERLLAEELDRLGEVVADHHGRVLKRLGDGLMAGFGSAVAALDAAARMHRAVAQLSDERHLHSPLQVRVAVAASDVLVDAADDVSGAAPIHAARTEKLVPAGQSWCTEAVRLLASGRGAHEFESVGTHEFKGVAELVELHRVRVPIADVLGMPASLDGTRRFAFVGRGPEEQRLREAWQRANAGHGKLIVICGEPGLGKTRLCREFAREVRDRGAIVLHGRCPEGAGEPYAPFAQILRTMSTYVLDAPSIMGSGVAELARIAPGLGRVAPGLPAPSDVDAMTDRVRLFDAVVDWLRALSARASVLLVIDDLSSADEPTVHLLRHVAARIVTDHVLLLASYRPADAQPPARAMLREREAVEQLRLRGLSDHDVVSFVERVLGGPLDASGRQTAIYVGEHVGGNPLYLGEMVPSLVEGGVLEGGPAAGWRAGPTQQIPLPAAVDDLIRDRVGRLPAVCQEILRVAAVIGFEFSAELLLDLVEIPPLAAVDALDRAVAADLVHCEQGSVTYEFTHAIVRQAVDAGIAAVGRRVLHRRIGEAIESRFADQLDEWAETLAYHFENAGGRSDAAKAITYLRAAAATASARLAHDHAADLCRRALTLAERWSGVVTPAVKCDILIELGTAQRRAGNDTARATLTTAADLALELRDAVRATAAVLGLGRGTFSIAGSVDQERVHLLRNSLELVGTSPSVPRARVLATLSSELAFDDDPTAAERASDEALAIARELGDVGLLVTVLGNRLVGLWRVDRIDERLAHAAELETLCNLAGDNRRGKFLSAMTTCCQAAMEAGDFTTADRLLAWIDETAATLHQPTAVAYAKLRLASRACLAGRFDEAERLAHEAFRLSDQAGQPDAEVFHIGQLFTIRYHQGRTAEVIDRLADAGKKFPGIVAFTAAEAMCAAEIDDGERCRAVIGPVVEHIDTLRRDPNWLTTMVFASSAATHLDDRRAAARLRPLIAPYRRLFVDNASAFSGSVHHYYAMLSAALGEEDEADAAFEVAIAAHAQLGSPPWQARTHVEYATALAARGAVAVAAAHKHAAAALSLGRRLGLRRVVDRAQAMLARDQPGSPARAARGSAAP